MKRFTVIAAGLALAMSTTASAQHPPTGERPYFADVQSYRSINVEKAKANFLASLKSGNDGVVESALAHVTQMRLALPDQDLTDIGAMLMYLSENGRTPVVRYKASLACLVYERPLLFGDGSADACGNGDAFFSSIAGRLAQVSMGYNP